MKYKHFKIKEGKKQQWLIWCAFLIEHEKEVIDTLIQEQCTREICWINGTDIFYGAEGLCVKGDDRQLNIDHRKNARECLEYVSNDVLLIPKQAHKLFDFAVKDL